MPTTTVSGNATTSTTFAPSSPLENLAYDDIDEIMSDETDLPKAMTSGDIEDEEAELKVEETTQESKSAKKKKTSPGKKKSTDEKKDDDEVEDVKSHEEFLEKEFLAQSIRHPEY